jgi:hypothetical protein
MKEKNKQNDIREGMGEGKTRMSVCHQFDHTSRPRDLEMAQSIEILVNSMQLRSITGSNAFCVRMRGAAYV